MSQLRRNLLLKIPQPDFPPKRLPIDDTYQHFPALVRALKCHRVTMRTAKTFIPNPSAYLEGIVRFQGSCWRNHFFLSGPLNHSRSPPYPSEAPSVPGRTRKEPGNMDPGLFQGL